MALSNEWQDATEIYSKPIKIERDLSKRIYRSKELEAFVIKEREDSYWIEGGGVRCWIWKHTSKNKIVNVSPDYKLRNK